MEPAQPVKTTFFTNGMIVVERRPTVIRTLFLLPKWRWKVYDIDGHETARGWNFTERDAEASAWLEITK